MDTQTSIVWGLVIYKVISLLVGLASCYMGYRLFVKGIWGEAGDLNAKFGDNKLVLKGAAPGTFFAVLGTLVICVTLWKGMGFDQYQRVDGITSQLEVNAEEKKAAEDEILDQLPEELPE